MNKFFRTAICYALEVAACVFLAWLFSSNAVDFVACRALWMIIEDRMPNT